MLGSLTIRRTTKTLLLQPVFLSLRSHSCPTHNNRRTTTTPTRTVVTYLRDVLRSGSLAPTNPILESIFRGTEEEERDAASTAPAPAPDQTQPLPQFWLAQPHHVTAAIQHVQETQARSLEKVEKLLLNDTNVKESSTTPEEQLEQLIELLNEMEEPSYTLRQISSLLWLMAEHDDKAAWEEVAQEASAATTSVLEPDNATISTAVHEKLQALLFAIKTKDDSESARNLRWSATAILSKYEQQTGQRVLVPSETANDDAQLETYQHMSEALQEVVQKLLATKLGVVKPQLLSAMYNFIGLHTEQAKLLGYRNFCHQVLQSQQRQAKVDGIQKLHAAFAGRIVPQVVDDMGVKKSQEERELEAYLSDKDTAKDEVEFRHKMDRYLMLKLQEHVTLDGALNFIFRMSQDLFGLSFERADTEHVNGWNKDVLLYHVFDKSSNGNNENNSRQYVGSFYIDPFAREGKHARPATIPIFPRGPNKQPVVCLSLEIEAPAWDDDAPMLKWQDCEALFHEIGHVLQFLLARPQQGTLLGPQTMALDISEFLPKFIELFLTEKSTLYTLIDLSKSSYPLSDEEIELAFKVRSREKALKLVQLTYYSRLELELFSGFDLKGSETILALQERLGKELIPHDVPDPEDATPLLDILQENAQGRHVAWYRYLWCDALSAAVFEKFKHTYATDPGAVPALGRKLRRLVLEPGATVDAAAIQAAFDIQEYSADVLCEQYDL